MDEVITRRRPEARFSWGGAWNEIKARVFDLSIEKSKNLRYEDNTQLEQAKRKRPL